MVRMMVEDHERRKCPRFEVSFPVSFRVFAVLPESPGSDGIKGIGTRTVGRVGNISLEGLFIEANPTQDQISEIIKAKREQDRFDVEIETNLMGENITMMGKVVWYDINFLEETPHHFRAGVFLAEMDMATKQVWERLIARTRN